LQGNVLELAIGIIIGGAFTNVVQSLVNDMITPPLGLLLGGVDFINLTIQMKNFVYPDQPAVVIRYGKFSQTILSLFIIAFILFLIVKGSTKLRELAKKKRKEGDVDETVPLTCSDEVKVLCEIRDLLSRQKTYVESIC
jgi:large conductance mechanosensitive channel